MAWLGANDFQSEGNFVWESSGAPLSYLNWFEGEPNNLGGNEGCMHFRTDGQWNDRPCQLVLPAMCEVLFPCF